MPLYLGWTMEADEVVALPVDDLALRVLRDARDADEWNWHNWVRRARVAYQKHPDAVLALTEAWTWLLNRGLVVWNVHKDTPASFMISRQGHAALDRGLAWIQAVQRLDIELVPVLEAKARPQFLRGDFEAAALLAMKEVELRVRTMANLPDSLTGTALMQQAFRPGRGDQAPGPLTDQTVDGGEAVGMMELFKGAIGLFKNPPSHRRVDYKDPTEAAEVLLLADLLMRLLDKIEKS
ncbi:TIGR02391 family protein [Streptomyces sp. JH002]|uniref:TIGR02391 family protein n=1 Tax=Streptomyces sp. JH002 TaxID=2763259 RepID=UPI003D80A0FC